MVFFGNHNGDYWHKTMADIFNHYQDVIVHAEGFPRKPRS